MKSFCFFFSLLILWICVPFQQKGFIIVIDNEVAMIRIIVNFFLLKLGGKENISIYSFMINWLFLYLQWTYRQMLYRPIGAHSWMVLKQNLQHLFNNSIWIHLITTMQWKRTKIRMSALLIMYIFSVLIPDENSLKM